ncbi:MAG: TIGR00366 family protein [Gammaproteobacteria bacterium]|nr:TIGR00366 family protein [Gammaproteobacteria bacterium]NNC56486.1 YfcC family protein [Woeseiaceae bacterium]NNL51612.1 YfcC family protein [Woeseiaceae bacterium]
MSKRSWSIDSLVLIFSFIVVAQLLSYVVPHGSFERVPAADDPSRFVVVDGTYTALAGDEITTLPPWHFLIAVSDGLESAQGIIFLIFLVGGVISVLRKTGAIDAALHGAVERLGKTPWLLIGGCLLLFSIGSFTIGMGEEYVPLVPIIVTMSLAMRMDAIVAMGMVWVPYGIGWACAGINPFGVLIAQNIANVPLTSGWGLRLAMMFVFLAIAFHHIYRYAIRVQKDPSASLVSHVDYSVGFQAPADVAMTRHRVAVLAVFVLGLIGFVYGVSEFHWYISELNAIFLGIGIVAAIISRMPAGETSRTFIEGAAAMTPAALLVGFARTIEVVMTDGQIIDSVVFSIAGVLEGLPAEASALGMLLVQTICNFFIPSGSGQAFVTMPIMSPLATLTDIPQQTAVLAFQFGDGFTNMIVPTSALVMGALALGKVPYSAWFRFVGPLLLKMFALAALFLVLSMHVGPMVGF